MRIQNRIKNRIKKDQEDQAKIKDENTEKD